MAHLTTRWLKEHVAGLAEPVRYVDSVKVLERFYAVERQAGRITGQLMLDQVTSALVDRFVSFRKSEGASLPTISRDLAALRGPINWGLREQVITAAPRVKDVKGKAQRRELEYDAEQVAAILEAAWAQPERRHVHLFTMIALSTHLRVEAILDLTSSQIRTMREHGRTLIFSNAAGRVQTRKFRSVVPVVPTLAPWLDGLKGKVIRYRAPIAERRWADPKVPEWFERDTYDIGNAFEGTLIAAGLAHPSLGLVEPVLDGRGEQVMLPPRRKLGETEPRPAWKGRGSPNTLRHTVHTQLQLRGVPQAQIDAAAGHNSEKGSGANYTHLRPDYLREFVDAIEDFWTGVGRCTNVHLRYQRDTKIINLADARAGS